tara:strand:- start:5638 stop:6477 length:840 start_codon:yes stop_codon:yes gene_type:complete
MAKKKTAEVVEEPLLEDTIVAEPQPVVTKPKPVAKKESANEWEIKDRTYILRHGLSPLSKSIKSANVYYFDEEKGYERELKYCSNQRTCFVDEMQGDQRLDHIVFRNGVLMVPRNKVTLQKLLSLYHPSRNKVYMELKPQVIAEYEISNLELEINALNAAQNLDIEMAEAVLRVEVGSKVSEMSSKELKRDILLYAKRNPKLFLELVKDENVMLRNFGIKAAELGIIRLSQDQRTFKWASNDRKLMTVPFDEHPYSALAAWFKTDEGMEVYSNIEKRLK